MKTKLLSTLALLGGLLFAASAQAQPWTLQRGVIGNGGGVVENDSVKMYVTIGQTAIGVVSNDAVTAYLGFWTPTFAATPSGVYADASAGSILSLNVSPNPMRGAGNISLNLAKAGNIEISLYDQTGKIVKRLFSGDRQAGTFTLPLDAAELASGAYRIAVSAPGALLQKPVTIVH